MKRRVQTPRFRCAALMALGLALASRLALADIPMSHSIAPDKPKPTPYGVQITRSDEQRPAPVAIRDVEEQVAVEPLIQVYEELEREAGPYDIALSKPLHDLGRVYQDSGRHREAMRLFHRSLHIAKVNEGLYTATQLPVLSDMIHSQIAMQRYEEADKFFNVLYGMQTKVYEPGSREMLDATRRYVDWQRQAYLQSVGRKPTFERLLDMHVIHSSEIERIEGNGARPDEMLPHLYDRLLVEYLISQYGGERQGSIQINVTGPNDLDPIMEGGLEGERFRQLQEHNERNGRKTLEQIIELEQAREPVDSVALAKAYLALGDWYLWWHRSGRALQNYESAWAVLDQDGIAETDPDGLFEQPVELPDTKVFLSDGTTPHEDVEARARVALAVSDVGRVRDIEILEQDPEGDMGARVVLFRLLRQVRFRPVLRDGKAVPYASLVRDYRYQY